MRAMGARSSEFSSGKILAGQLAKPLAICARQDRSGRDY